MKNKDILKQKWFLYATGFFSGMSVMAIELGASRLLAPYFSSSQIVWTVIIGTIMIAMAIGNVWGGRSADRNPDPKKLYTRLLMVAIWTALIPFLGKYIIALITVALALVVTKNFLVWASFAACIVLFVFPLMLLGTVTPSLMKYATDSLDDNGRTVGELEALGTIGSIIGTFTPTFITIPALGTSRTFLLFAAILAVISLAYFIGSAGGRGRVACIALSAAVIITAFVPVTDSFAFWEDDIAYEGESIYNYLKVNETDRSVILSTNVAVGVQSIMIKGGGLTGMYYDCALAAPLMSGEPESPEILILGLGTGTYANQCLDYFPGCTVEGVEIDRDITELAREYFNLSDEVKVTVGDGRAYLREAGKYDVIMVDAYQDITIPFQMSTVEFFMAVKTHLKENGVMVVNLNMSSSDGGGISEYLIDTISKVFDETAEIVVSNNTNTELFASDYEGMLERFEQNRNEISDVALSSQMQRVSDGLKIPDKGDKLLTDDRAPVELLGMRTIDTLIGEELDWIRTAIKEGDFSAILG